MRLGVPALTEAEVLRFEDYVEASRRAGTVAELARLYADAVGSEGYENCVLTSLRGRKLGHVAWFEFPDGYANAYIEKRWERIDPVLAVSLRALRPFLWEDVIARQKLSKEQVDFLGESQSLKVQAGIAFPFHGPGHRLDLMSISRRTDEAPNWERVGLLHAISVQSWTRYLELSEESPFFDDSSALTARELEILRWCKEGKSRPEIGEILSISHKTVEFHLCNLMNKLGANNQITAVVIALQRGLIEL
jgi:LuxR family transcriptional regulator, quorum-sensing system regulator SolR